MSTASTEMVEGTDPNFILIGWSPEDDHTLSWQKLTPGNPIRTESSIASELTSLDGHVIGCIDGVLAYHRCFDYRRRSVINIFNPTVGDWIVVPNERDFRSKGSYHPNPDVGFGALNQVYTLVRIWRSLSGTNMVELFTLGQNKWHKPKRHSEFKTIVSSYWSGYLNGAIYWIGGSDGKSRTTLLSFDLKDELFTEQTLPDQLVNDGIDGCPVIGSLAQTLALAFSRRHDSNEGSDVCVWTRDGVSWTRKFCITFDVPAIGLGCFYGSGITLLKTNAEVIYVYLETGDHQTIFQVDGSKPFIDCLMPCIKSDAWFLKPIT